MDPCNFINKAISHTPEEEIHTRPKLYHFGCYLVKAKLFVENVLSRSPSWNVHMGDFHPGYRNLGRKNRDLSNRASQAPHMNTSIFLQRKEWQGEISETEPAQLTGLM